MEVDSQSWRGTPLPSGRHTLDPLKVLASQRTRILRAMLEMVGEHGYSSTTVPDVIAAARVSGNSFYKIFDDKLDCFLALCDEEGEDLFESGITIQEVPDWKSALKKGVAAYLKWWQDRPAFSRAYLVELSMSWQRAADQRQRVIDKYCLLFQVLAGQMRLENPDLPDLPAFAPQLLALGVTSLIATEVRNDRLDTLDQLQDDLVEVIVACLSGTPTSLA